MHDFARDASFPSGIVTAKVRISDALGAETSVLERILVIESNSPVKPGRRLLSGAETSFYAQSLAKITEALRSSRVDQVNQLSGAIAIESLLVLTDLESKISLRSDLMSSLLTGTTKTVKTLSFSCEAFAAAVLVMNSTELVNAASVLHSGRLMKSLVLDVRHRQAVDSACAVSVALMIGSSMQAQSALSDVRWADPSLVPRLDNRSVHMLDQKQGRDFLQNIEHGSTELMTKVIWNEIAGGPERAVFANASRHVMARDKLTQFVNRTIRQSTPMDPCSLEGWFIVPGIAQSVFGIKNKSTCLEPASVTLPASLSVDLPMLADREVDVHLQGHSHAPAAAGLWIRSHMFGATLSLPGGGDVLNISNLSSPLKLDLPIHTYRMSAREQMLFTQQARCVFWQDDSYQTAGCRVIAVDGHDPTSAPWPRVLPLSLVTMESTHLTIFAVNQDYNAPACGDGIIQFTGGGIMQANEECDDSDIDGGDGCSSSCTVEEHFTCYHQEGGQTYGVPRLNGQVPTPSVCIAHPAPFGIQSKIVMGDFNSQADFTRYVGEFAEGISTSIGAGIKPTDVSVFKVCYESESACSTYFDVHADPEKMRRSGLERRSGFNNKVVVYFQVNAPQGDGVYRTVLGIMRTYAFLPSFVSHFIVLTGKSSVNADWLQAPALLNPEYAPGWTEPKTSPDVAEMKDYRPLVKPNAALDEQFGFLEEISTALGLPPGFVIFTFVLMILIIAGSLWAVRYFYKKKSEQLAETRKVAPEPLPPGVPREQPKTPESPHLVALQDGVAIVSEALLDAGWGARSIINTETVAEIFEEDPLEEKVVPKPAPPPPLPPGKMKRPNVPVPDIDKLRKRSERARHDLDNLIAANRDSSADEHRSHTSAATSTTEEVLIVAGQPAPMVPSPPPRRSSVQEAGGAVEVSSDPTAAATDTPRPQSAEKAQSKIARLKKELNWLISQEAEEEPHFNAEKANRSTRTGSARRTGPDDDKEYDDTILFSGTRNYASLRGRFQTEEVVQSRGSSRAAGGNSESLDQVSRSASRAWQDAGTARDEEVPYTPSRRMTTAVLPRSALPSGGAGASFQPSTPRMSAATRPDTSTAQEVHLDSEEGSPEPWTPGVSGTPFERNTHAPLMHGSVSPPPARNLARRNFAMLGSLSRPHSTAGARSSRPTPPAKAVTNSWLDEDDDDEAGAPYVRPTTSISPMARQIITAARSGTFAGESFEPGVGRHGSRYRSAASPDASIQPDVRSPSASPERRDQIANPAAHEFSSPRSPSRLLDDKILE